MRAHILMLVVSLATIGCESSFLHSIPEPEAPNDGAAAGQTDCASFGAVTGLAASVDDTTVNLTWAGDANGPFTIEVSTPTADYTAAATGITGRQYQDTTCRYNDSKCLYRIRYAPSCVSESILVYTAPAMPPSLMVTAQAVPPAIDLAWSNPDQGDIPRYTQGYVLERALAEGPFGVLTIVSDPNTTSYHDAAIASDSYYRYRVHAYNADSNSVSANANVWSSPAPVTALSASTGTDNRIALAWTDANNAHVTGYEVVRSTQGAAGTTLSVPLGSGSAHQYSDVATLALDTLYTYQVVAVHSYVEASQPVVVRGPAVQVQQWALPAPPGALNANNVNGVPHLSWTDNPYATGYIVLRQGAAVGSSPLAAHTTTYDDSNAPAETQVQYKVLAINPGGYSADANVSLLTVPDPPMNLSQSGYSPNHIVFTWQRPASGTSSLTYRVDRVAPFETNNTGMTNWYDNVPNAGQSYVYNVYSLNGGGASLPASFTGVASSNPNVAVNGNMVLANNCNFTLSTSVSFDVAHAANANTFSAIVNTTNSNTLVGYSASATGVTGTLNPNYSGNVAVFYTATDTLGGSTQIFHSARFAPTQATYFSTPPALPTLFLGDDAGPGRQPLSATVALPAGCSACSGTRASISMHGTSGCVLASGGFLYCWGNNSSGQLGSGDTISPRQFPMPVCESGATSFYNGTPNCNVATLTGALMVAQGGDRGCALMGSGGVRCWNTTYGSPTSDLVSNVVGVFAASGNVCTVYSDGTAGCWGYVNSNGQFGDGTTSATVNPPGTTVCATGSGGTCQALQAVRTLGVADDHACALVTANGNVMCWGANPNGQVGDGTTTGRQNPVAVCQSGNVTGGDCVPLTGAVAVAAGSSGSSCAVMNSGQVMCWGNNSLGQLGDGTTTDRPHPVTVCKSGATGSGCVPLDGIESVALGYDHACALDANTNVFCWGNADHGQVGDGVSSNTAARLNPVLVCSAGSGAACTGLGGAVAIASGTKVSCAVIDSGAVSCWGSSTDRALCDGLSFAPGDAWVAQPANTAPSTPLTGVAYRSCGAFALQ